MNIHIYKNNFIFKRHYCKKILLIEMPHKYLFLFSLKEVVFFIVQKCSSSFFVKVFKISDKMNYRNKYKNNYLIKSCIKNNFKKHVRFFFRVSIQ